ncbi:MAG: hypothetical protein NTZ40_02010 [Cyanobacteria bacterium]|nr:hypothetical protein [Cyanobacteriota bacterium]
MKLRHFLLVGGIAAFAAIATAPAAQAVLAFQTVGPVAFSTSGTAVNSSNLVFAPFNAAPAASLTGIRISGANPNDMLLGSFSENASLAKLSGASRTFTATGTPTFTFSNGSNLTGTASSITLTPNTVTGAGTQGVISTLSGNYLGSFSSLTTNTPTLRNYFSTGTPTINNSVTAYAIVSTPVGGVSSVDLDPGDGVSAVFSGIVYVTYEYDDGTVAASVPTPLPLLGAGAAFGFTRKLRRRIQSSAS